MVSKLLAAAAFGSMLPWTLSTESADTCGPYGCAVDEDWATSEEANGTSVSLLQRRLGQESKDRRAPCQPQAAWPSVPSKATDYNGKTWPELCFSGAEEKHVMLMGDYGGITRESHGEVYATVANNIQPDNKRGRNMYRGVDDRAQQLVSDQMRKYASKVSFDYALNGGDNFYFGGIDTKCGIPMNTIHDRTRAQFDVIFETMYRDLNFPFLGVLGNHDYGGIKMNAAWDQQVAYTWAEKTTKRWILPALYWHQHVRYPDADFSVDYFMIDTNSGDAHAKDEDPNHNICGADRNRGANCAANGGPANVDECLGWFRRLWAEQQTWLEKHLEESAADWQVVVTHFPPDAFMGTAYWKHVAATYGLDLFVGSHRHYQQIYKNYKKYNGLNYVVCGGGGGITSEFNPDNSQFGREQYGFMDLTITKTQMKVTAIDERGQVSGEMSFGPRPPMCLDFDGEKCQQSIACAKLGCGDYVKGQYCQCNADCAKHNSCCHDFAEACGGR